MKRSWLIFPIALLLWSCSHNAPSPQQAARPAPSATVENPINFSLPAGSVVIAAKKFSQTVTPDEHASSLLSSGAGTYAGNEVIAGTTMSFADLQSWLRKLESDSPKGYRFASESSGMTTVRDMVTKRGIDFAVFRDSENPKRALLLVAIDPATANRDLGPVLGLVKRYQVLPAALRGNIEDMVKRRSGISIDQMLQPGSPVGLAMNAMTDFTNKDQRAIVLVDAAKE